MRTTQADAVSFRIPQKAGCSVKVSEISKDLEKGWKFRYLMSIKRGIIR